MKALFFIQIQTDYPTEALAYSWYKKELPNDSYGYHALAEIKNQSLNCEVILVLPGFYVTQKQVSSTLKNRKKLELAIAYQLEEVLSDEIEALFFAYQATKDKNVIEVAVINREWFEIWLKVFNQAGIVLTAVITELMLLNTMPQAYLLIERPSGYLLKTPSLSYAIDSENVNYFLQQLKESLPKELCLISDNSQLSVISDDFFVFKKSLLQTCLLKLLSENYILGNELNLLQGVYQPQLKNDWQKIKWGSVGLLSLLFIAMTFQLYQYWQLTAHESRLLEQQKKIFQHHFPALKKVVNPFLQMKHEIGKLKQSQQQQGQFIAILAKVAIALKSFIAQEKIQILGIEFTNNELQLVITTKSVELIEQIRKNMIQQKLTLDVQAPKKIDNQFNAVFKVTENNK